MAAANMLILYIADMSTYRKYPYCNYGQFVSCLWMYFLHSKLWSKLCQPTFKRTLFTNIPSLLRSCGTRHSQEPC